MADQHPDAATPAGGRGGRSTDSRELAWNILHSVNRGLPRTDFLRAASEALMTCTGCDAVEVRLSDGGLPYRWVATRRPKPTARFDLARWQRGADGQVVPASDEATDLEYLCAEVAGRRFDPGQPFFTAGGSFWTSDAWERFTWEAGPATKPRALCVAGHYRSLAIVRFVVDEATIGLLLLKRERPSAFTKEDVADFEGMAQTLGLALADWRAQYALRERVKELTCLYGIAQVAERTDLSLEERLQVIVNLLPPAWQYPEIAAARLVIDGRSYVTAGFRPGRRQQSANITVRRRRRGVVEVHYLDERPEFAVQAFLKEEEKLLAVVAREVALTVERQDVEGEHQRLQQQLIHADRLATIGQLAAGVAHELNEPLGSILGFAQLAGKCPGLPEPAARDLEKIVTWSLYAREIIKKLMVFARQVPPRKTRVNLNQVVEECLRFLDARCTRAGTQVVRDLDPALPEIHGDPAQLTQVLVNLVVNAVQAMPQGGTLTIRTRGGNSGVSLVVEDTGTGMDEEVLGRIFLPFFTTKDVSEGTGLGLPVVHGIVSAHGGTIDVQSRPGLGTRFEVRLPVASVPQHPETDPNGDRR